MIKKLALTSLTLAVLLLSSCALPPKNPPSTAEKINLGKYMGKWYEIASFPNRFQRGCRCTTAQYKMVGQKIKMLNRCIKGDNKKYSEATATAWVPNKNDPSKLKVRFFWPFTANYWILYIGQNYQYALVGSPHKDYLWILSRKPTMDEVTYKFILKVAQHKGFDISKLVKTEQNCN